MTALEARPHLEEADVGDLFGRAAVETGTLLRQQLELAAAELTATASQAGRQALVLGVGASFGAASLVVLSAAVVLTLGLIMPLGLAALIVGVGLGLIASIVLYRGLHQLRQLTLRPTRTIQSIEENKSWLLAMVR